MIFLSPFAWERYYYLTWGLIPINNQNKETKYNYSHKENNKKAAIHNRTAAINFEEFRITVLSIA